MIYVLTGEQQYQVESLVDAALTTNQKKKEKQRKRRRSGFHRRPYRTLNEEKKRKASCQKAEDSNEANNTDDLVMEVPEDQPLDYAIDEYLDASSKLLNILHSQYNRHSPRRLHRASQELESCCE